MRYRLSLPRVVAVAPRAGLVSSAPPCRRLLFRSLLTDSRARSESNGTLSSIVSRSSPFMTLLLVAGVAATAFGVYDIYGTMTMWPPVLRKDLRDGLKAKYKGDLGLSARYLQRAWDNVREFPKDGFQYEPYLKASGIGIALAGVLESDGKPELAYKVYSDALHLPDTPNYSQRILTGRENMRIVALSYKLGEMAKMLNKPKEEEEKWLVLGVETVLKKIMERSAPVGEFVEISDKVGEEDAAIMVSELELPLWVNHHDLAAPFEALGSFYSQEGKISFALPLYLQAVSILIPPAPLSSSKDNKCRGAQIMGAISELILRSNPNGENIAQAEAWAKKGLEVAEKERKGFRTNEICEAAYAVMLYNLAMVRQMAGDSQGARKLFTQSLDQSKEIGLGEGVTHASEALQALHTEKVERLLPGVPTKKAT